MAARVARLVLVLGVAPVLLAGCADMAAPQPPPTQTTHTSPSG